MLLDEIFTAPSQVLGKMYKLKAASTAEESNFFREGILKIVSGLRNHGESQINLGMA